MKKFLLPLAFLTLPLSGCEKEEQNFTCSGKTTCGQMSSCAEAKYYLKNCGVANLDHDNDGTPCETLCK